MKKLTGKEAIEFQIEAWYLVLEEGMNKTEAGWGVAEGHGLEPAGCLLCLYAGTSCEHCPLTLIAGGTCHEPDSPYADWLINPCTETVEGVIGYLYGVQAEWKIREE